MECSSPLVAQAMTVSCPRVNPSIQIAQGWRVYAFPFLDPRRPVGQGLWPALRASRFRLTEMLKEGGGRVDRPDIASKHRGWDRCLALVVLICGGLFVHSLRQLEASSLGFRPDRLLMASLDLSLQRYGDDRGRQFLDRLVERTGALPGVSSATLALHVPFDLGIQVSDVAIDGEIPGSKDGYVSTSFNVVAHDFFETAGVSVSRGAVSSGANDKESRRVGVLNENGPEAMAATGCGRKRFRFGRDGAGRGRGRGRQRQVRDAGGGAQAYFYLPLDQP